MDIRTRPLMTLRLRVGTPQIVGQTPIGDRRIVPVLDVADRDTRGRREGRRGLARLRPTRTMFGSCPNTQTFSRLKAEKSRRLDERMVGSLSSRP
jgi:hypothetical protein